MLDSWSYLMKNNNSVSLDQKYFVELKKLIKLLNKDKFNFVNIYADPSHIINSKDFLY